MGGKGKGKGKGPLGPLLPGPGFGAGFGPGLGRHHHHHHGWRGPGPIGLAAEAAVVGGVTAAVVASTVARPRRRRRSPPCRLPPQQVVVVGAPAAAAPAAQQVAYVSDGRLVRGKGNGKGKGKGGVAVVEQPPLLEVTSVALPRNGMELRGSVTFYSIQVVSRSGDMWTVFRRYNDFYALQQKLGSVAQSFPDAPFPKKVWFGCKGETLEGRRRGLEVWLTRALQNPASSGPWLEPLRQFTEGGRNMLSAGVSRLNSNPRVLDSPLTLPAAASAPPLEADIQDNTEDHDGTFLEIEVPAGVAAGQLLGVTLPDGQQLTVPVPEGAAAGATLELLYNSANGTLRIVGHE